MTIHHECIDPLRGSDLTLLWEVGSSEKKGHRVGKEAGSRLGPPSVSLAA